MAYYNSPADMYEKRTENFKKSGDRHWAMAKRGEGNHHYGQAKACYAQAQINQAKAAQAKSTGASWKK